MGDRKRKFSHETELQTDAVIALLEGVIEGLRREQLHLEHGEQALTLRPGGVVRARVEGRCKPKHESLALELSWTPAPVEPVLRIGAGAVPVRPIPAAASGGVTPARVEAMQTQEEGEVQAGAGAGAAQEGETDDIPADEGAAGEARVDVERLAALPRARLRELARAVQLERRSQLSKRRLAEALSEVDLAAHLSAEQLAELRAEVPG